MGVVINKRNIIFLGLIFILTLLIFTGFKKYNENEHISYLSQKQNENLIKLDNKIFNTYITLYDSDGKVIDSTNPNNKIDSQYQYSVENAPQVKISLDQDLYIEYELVNLVNEAGELLIDESKTYYTDIPSYIIPDESVVIGTKNGPKGEIRLYKLGNVDCYGGIYMEGSSGYRLKFRFENTAMQSEISVNYKLKFNLSNTIENQALSLKQIDFKELGILKFWLEDKENIPDKENEIYSLKETIQQNTISSSIQDFTTTITDNRLLEEREMKGRLEIELNEYIGISTDYSKWFDNIKIYADNKEVSFIGGSYNVGYYATDGKNIDITLNILDQYLLEYDNSSYSSTKCYSSNKYSCFIKKLSINFGNAFENNESIHGIKEWKIVIREKMTQNSGTALNNITYIDYTGVTSALTAMNGITINGGGGGGLFLDQSPSGQLGFVDLNLKYNHNGNSNYVSFSIDGSYRTESRFYYMNQAALLNSSNLNDTLSINIDNKNIEFVSNIFFVNSLINGHSTKADPALQMQMKNVFGSKYKEYFNNTNYYGYNEMTGKYENVNLYKNKMIWRSKELNQDGEYYWLVFDIETIYNNYKYGYSKNGRNEYSKYICANDDCTYYQFSDDTYSDKYDDAIKFKLYLFNISNHEVQINIPYKLGYSRNTISYQKSSKNKNLGIRYSFSTNNNQEYKSMANFINPYDTKNNVSITSTHMIDNIIKWQVTIDYSEFNYFYSTNKEWYMTYLYLSLPNELEMLNSTNGYVYSPTEDKIVRFGGTYEQISNGINLGYNNLFVCTDFNCNNLSYITPFQINPNFKYSKINDNYISDFKNEGRSNYVSVNGIIPRNSSDQINLIFFTKTKDSYINDNTNKDYQIYFQSSTAGTSIYTKAGIPTFNIDYLAKGISLKEGIVQKEVKETEDNNKLSWNVKSSLVSNNVSINKPYIISPNYFNGTYQISDQMDGIAADFTTLEDVSISVNNIDNTNSTIYLSKEEINDFIENGTTISAKCNDNGICVKIGFNIDEVCARYKECLISNYGPDYLEELQKMSNGFYLKIIGLKDAIDLNISYTTTTDKIAMYNYIKEEQNIKYLISNYDYTLSNKAIVFDYSKENERLPKKQTIASSTDFDSQIIADLYITKKSSELSENQNEGHIYLSRDNIENQVSAIVGYSPTKYINIKDLLLGFEQENYLIDQIENVNNVNEKEALLEFKKYLELRNMSIFYCENIKSETDCQNKQEIYNNGKFSDEWSKSSIVFSEDTTDLYNLHLEKNDGVIPPQSRFIITYNLIFDIDNNRKVTDENNNLIAPFRNSTYYKGGKLDVITIVGAERTYENQDSDNILESKEYLNRESDSNYKDLLELYKSYYDNQNNTLIVYSDKEVKTGYLKKPEIHKYLENKVLNNSSISYEVVYNPYSLGNKIPNEIDITDNYYFEMNIDPLYSADIVEKIRQLDNLIKEYSAYANLLLLYKENIYNSSDYVEIINIKGKLKESEVYQTEIYNIILELTNNSSYNFNIKNIQYDSEIRMKYDVIIDYEAFYNQAIIQGLLDEKYNISGTDIPYEVVIKNSVTTINEEPLKSETTSGYISISDYTPKIKKEIISQKNDTTKWQIKFNTGTSNDNIRIVDKIKVNGSDKIADSIIIDNIIISIGSQIIYINNNAIEGYEDNIDIHINKLDFIIDFKNSDNDFITNNNNITISYETHLDNESYNELQGLQSGSYSLTNEAILEKNKITKNDIVETDKISFDFPLTINKTFIGNSNNNLYETSWNITINTGSLNRNKIYITDTINIDEKYQKYFSISNISISLYKNKEKKIIYNSNDINNLSTNIKILDHNKNDFSFNQNGLYNFIIYIDQVDNLTDISIDYTLSIDREKYEYDKEIEDIPINISNLAQVNSDNVEGPTASATGVTTVPSRLKKSYNYNGLSKNNLPLITWTIDVNLSIDYGLTLTNDDSIVLEDLLDEILKYYDGTIKIYELSTEANGITQGNELVIDKDYTFEIENNKITIKLLNANTYNNFRAVFDTELIGNTDNIENSVMLRVNDKIQSANVTVPIIPNNIVGGTVNSQGMSYYTYYANKYLDNKLANISFDFELKEVDYDGNIIQNGTNIITQNNQEGIIAFGPISYKEEGIHYYRIYEKYEDEKYNYDKKIYTLKVKVVNYKHNYVVEEVSVVNEKENIISFYNETKKEQIQNPNTNNNIIYIKIIFLFSILLLIGSYNKKKELL